jgi:hypothetical protein
MMEDNHFCEGGEISICKIASSFFHGLCFELF